MSKKKVDEGELYNGAKEEVVEEPVEEVKEKKTRTPAIKVSEEDILLALKEAGGSATPGQLRNYIKEKYPDVDSPRLGTAIRKKALELAENGKIEALHINEKRNYTFKSKE